MPVQDYPTLTHLQQLILHKGVEGLRNEFYEPYNNAIFQPISTYYTNVDTVADVISFWDTHPETQDPYVRTLYFQDALQWHLDKAASSASLYIGQRLENLQATLKAEEARGIHQRLQMMLAECESDSLLARYPILVHAVQKLIREVTLYVPNSAVVEQPEQPSQGEPSNAAHSFLYRYPESEADKGKSLVGVTKSVLGNLLAELKGAGFVSQDTKAADFSKIFSGKPVPETGKVTWIGSYAELRAFVHAFEKKQFQHTDKKISNKWAVAIKCFVDADGKAFTADQLRLAGPASSRKAVLISEKVEANLI